MFSLCSDKVTHNLRFNQKDTEALKIKANPDHMNEVQWFGFFISKMREVR